LSEFKIVLFVLSLYSLLLLCRPKNEKKKEEKIVVPAEKQEKEKPVSPVRSPIQKTLTPPKIPEIGGYLDVIVVMAASPCNFIVLKITFHYYLIS